MFDVEFWDVPVYYIAAVIQFVFCMFLAGHFSNDEKFVAEHFSNDERFAEAEEAMRARYERQKEKDKLLAYALMYGGLFFCLICFGLSYFIAPLLGFF